MLGFHSLLKDIALDILIFITNKDLALGLEGFLEQIYSVNKAEYSKTIDVNPMKIVGITRFSNRMITFHIQNTQLLEGKEALRCVFDILTKNETFIQFSETKVIFTVAEYDDCKLSYHKNVLITRETTFNDYWEEIQDYVNEKYLSSTTGYGLSVVNKYLVTVWDIDHLKNKNIKIERTVDNQIETTILDKIVLNIKLLLDLIICNLPLKLFFLYGNYKLNKIFNQTINTINRFTTVRKVKSNKLRIQKSGFHTSAISNKGYIKPLKKEKQS